jgi:hypothetical protein
MISEVKIRWMSFKYSPELYAISREFSLYSKQLKSNPTNVKWFLYELEDYLDI